MKLLLFKASLIWAITFTDTVFSQEEKEWGVSTKWRYQHFGQRHLLQSSACSLSCFRGRLVESCKCRCYGNWGGMACDERVCRPWQWSCDLKRKCINKQKVCDKVQNCKDGTDEQGCDCAKICDNGGILDRSTCTCSCTYEWTGDLCRTPSASASCGIRLVDSFRIVGGHPADIADHPWQVQLRYRFNGRRLWSFACGGTLISARHVVTAAHCVTDKSTNRWQIYLGRERRQRGGLQLRRASKIYIHENYNSLVDNNDIALMILDIPVTFSEQIQPICLHRAELYSFNSDSACFISGWGSFEIEGFLPHSLQAAQIVLIPQEQCADIYDELTDKMICASESLQLLGTVDTCQGDSGGPLACASVDSYGFLRWFLVGITSFGYGCGEPGLPGVYTRLSEFVDWLDEKMNTPF